jgi:hypothetical protein
MLESPLIDELVMEKYGDLLTEKTREAAREAAREALARRLRPEHHHVSGDPVWGRSSRTGRRNRVRGRRGPTPETGANGSFLPRSGGVSRRDRPAVKPEIHATVHGLDAEGIILVARWPWSYSGVGGEYKYSDAMARETYWIHAGSETTLVTFEAAEDPAQRTPSVIFQYRVEGGRLAWRRTFNSRDANEVQYEWCENRLVREVHCCSSHPRYVPGEDPWAGTEDPCSSRGRTSMVRMGHWTRSGSNTSKKTTNLVRTWNVR